MHNRLLLFLKRHNILTCEQHRFLESKSTETASHSFIQCFQEALDRHLQAVGILLDLSKAYDVINHNRLLDKLDSYGIRGSVNKWFQSYVTNRTQFVEITQTDRSKYTQHRFQSSWRVILYGVPQGSILRPPFVFNIYQWSTIKYSRSKIDSYADDTTVFVVDRNEEALQTKLSLVMKQLENWFLKNDLFINTTKTAAVIQSLPLKASLQITHFVMKHLSWIYARSKIFRNAHYRKSKLACS